MIKNPNELNNFDSKIKIRIAGDKMLLLRIDEITYFFSHGKYAYIHTTTEEKRELTYHSLTMLEAFLPKSSFLRAGRQHLLNLNYIHRIDLRNRICTMRIDRNNIFDIKNLSERAIKAILSNENFIKIGTD